jgi:hypothetical protein
VSIHQIQITYDAGADRLLWQVRTVQAQLFSFWLTRRMTLRLWQPLKARIAQQMAPVTPGAVLTPQAREMLDEAARSQPLPQADFKAPFKSDGVQRPLGEEPMLVSEVNLTHDPQNALLLQWRDAQGRTLTLRLERDLSLAVLRLLEAALVRADWGIALVAAPTADAPTGEAAPNFRLN